MSFHSYFNRWMGLLNVFSAMDFPLTLMLTSGRIASQHAKKIRDLGQVAERILYSWLVFTSEQIQVEQVFPRLPAQRAGLDLRQIQIAESERAQTAEQSAWNVARSKNQRSFPFLGPPGRGQFLGRIQQKEAREISPVVLN